VNLKSNLLEVGLTKNARERYYKFLNLCATTEGQYRLTPLSDPSPYATCFWIFGMHLLKKNDVLISKRNVLIDSVRRSVRSARAACDDYRMLSGKPYRQLLSFSLSALYILEGLEEDPLSDLVLEQLPKDVEKELCAFGCLEGKAQSGNQAMFMVIFLLHAKTYLNMNVESYIETWLQLHFNSMNKFGLWGHQNTMISLQYQNGYHQYEILEYLGLLPKRGASTADEVARFADDIGHFAPYPGGGGCYDYDAVFMLTLDGNIPDPRLLRLLNRTAITLLSEQQTDGGFCESLFVRPRSAKNIWRSFRHIVDALPRMPVVIERLRYAIALQRPRHDRIFTHWSVYSRRWDESDLWDSWFRMLTLARIECALDKTRAEDWGFIDYPGIGFHPLVRDSD
jgi:hypothetical protein